MDIAKNTPAFSIKDRVRTMSVKIYNKLIRDKIPQIIEQSGKQAIIEAKLIRKQKVQERGAFKGETVA